MATMSARVCAPALGLSLQQKIAPGASRRHAAVSHAALLPAGLRSRSVERKAVVCSALGGSDARPLWASPLLPSSPRRKLVCHAEAGTAGELPGSETPATKEISAFEKFIELLTTMFPIWVILGTLIGIYKPSAVTWLDTDLFTVCLGFLMLSMGLTLTIEDFRRCLRNPWTVGVGFLAQYMIKPILGFLIALGLKLSAPLATGLILVSCCPGGQASNVATYISKGNVALSVLMTTASTIGAIIMTPLLTKLLAGQLVPVDAVGLAVSTFQVVLLPTIIGVAAHEFFPKIVEKIIVITPLIGVVLTTLLCASPIGQVSEVLVSQGAQLILPVAILHAAAFALGYFMSKICKFGETTSRTISIECGMQSSALGFLLAQKHFSNPLVAVPSAVSVVAMALGGSALAVYWRNQPIPAGDKDDFKE
ncbi:bile acid:Na+ symporter, BASS family [Marchantia polymorpha subsp. ruderalis]|uniref:Uncharacterized protein n=1 Tax=Marchantia polymorpha TaxID=3197 RepID=A0A2R6X872_MARPO|nr:hypothetical protein MARPO_0030s0051 [Marchantia polymorpha]BBN20190.1 hypothetical protein Mp_8g17190 [Marchantia polymorpha subsp. ruderalis]|eukprot:PTQ42306.1 hypothetical protein MARPO_0030s0051 [Marchantia polymorpha]